MNERKTKSLTLPSDPVARLRELHDLDTPTLLAATGETVAHEHSNAATLELSHEATQQQANIATKLPANAAALPYSNGAIQEPENAAARKQGNTAARKRSNTAMQPHDAEEANPVHLAMRQALVRPYSENLEKGPMTATTIRIPTEIWERLDMASTLHGKTKQEIIAQALKEYLTRIGRGEV